MKFIVTILFILVQFVAVAQTAFIKEAVAKLDRALVSKDTISLKKLLHKDASYGHSNGWVENKQDVINHLLSGKLLYKKIESTDLEWKMTKDVASVRSKTELKYVLDGKDGELNLHVLQVWVKTNKGWQLIARQSTKI